MTAIYMDGFDHYSTGTVSATNMLAGSWVYSQEVSCATPPWGAARTGTYCLRNNGFGPSGNHYALPTPGTHFFVSLGFALDNLSTGSPYPILFATNTNTTILNLNVLSNGQIQVMNSTGTQIAITNGPIIKAENWHFLEMEIDTSAHTFTLRVDDASGADTALIDVTDSTITGTIALVCFLENDGGIIGNTDDVFIRDASGSLNNGFLGDRRVATMFADTDTATNAWTPNYYQILGTGILNNTAVNAAVDIATSTSLDVGSADFTLESFVRFQSLPAGTSKATIFSRWDQTNNHRSYELFLGSVALNSGCLCFQTSTDGTNATVSQPIVYPWQPNLNEWYHIAIVRASGEDLLFVNGQQFGLPIADSNTYFAGTSPFGIGAELAAVTNPVQANTQLDGWFNGCRFTNGFARYTTNFTPTTVEFPTGGSDAHWADVVLLMNFDSLGVIQDVSSFAQTTAGINGAVQFTPNDGPAIGSWSTVGKAIPDDNTFISAPFIAATGILTVTVNPSNGNTVTVGTKDGSTAAVYTFKNSISTAFDVLKDTNIQNTLQNLFNAINAGPGAGTKYGTGTTSNFDVNAVQLPAGQMEVIANIAGTGGNSIASTSSGITGSWSGSTLSGGLDIPGPTNFKTQRPPPTTTIISAVQVSVRAFKSDSGPGSINTAIIGPLGGVGTGPDHNLTISANYYNDIYEVDPDTSGPISPTTLTNGAIQINRDT